MSWLLSSVSERMLLSMWFNPRRPQKSGMFFINCFPQDPLQTTQKGADSVEEYILKMKGIAHDIMAAGQHISDDELILYILGGLGSDFESVVVNLTSRDALPSLFKKFNTCYISYHCFLSIHSFSKGR